MRNSMGHTAARLAATIVVAALAACAATDTDRPTTTPPAASATTVQPAPVEAVLHELAMLAPTPLEMLSAQQARRQPTVADAVRSVLTKLGRSSAPEAIGRAENRTIPSADGTMNTPIRVYWPNGLPPAAIPVGALPVIAYFHGGIWVNGSLDSHDSSARALANAAGAIVVSVQPRKAPEYRFPAAHEDAFAAYEWMLLNAAALGGDATRIAVVGEAAGGNLAASVALRARDRRLRMPVHQVLIHPILDLVGDTPSRREHRDARPLSAATLAWGTGLYLNAVADAPSVLASPLRATDLTGLPPATIITAGLDPLRSEGELYALRLRQAGVSVEYQHYAGLPHGFFGAGALVEEAKIAVSEAVAGLKRAFGR